MPAMPLSLERPARAMESPLQYMPFDGFTAICIRWQHNNAWDPPCPPSLGAENRGAQTLHNAARAKTSSQKLNRLGRWEGGGEGI